MRVTLALSRNLNLHALLYFQSTRSRYYYMLSHSIILCPAVHIIQTRIYLYTNYPNIHGYISISVIWSHVRTFEPAIIFKKIEANGLKKGGNKHPPRPLHHIWSKLRTFKGYNLQKITRNQLQVRLKVVSAKNSLKTSKEGTFFSISLEKRS